MIRIDNKSLCCGCTACQSVCPKDAISMKPDELGFLYPQVDADRCINCGLCEKVCDFVKHQPCDFPDDTLVNVYAACHRDEAVVNASQSGGVFTALSDLILGEGGVIYGAAFNDDYTVSHTRAASQEERNRLRGSKYVQSDMKDCFRQVYSDLKDGVEVLFTGTPCQVAGLKSYIPESLHVNLTTIDIVCHGVPSPAIWKDYHKYRTAQAGCREVNFRDKSLKGWKAHVESFTGNDDVKRYFKTFSTLFYTELMHRDSCYSCPYNVFERSSDITISDFWGVGEVKESFDGNQGTSLMICRTEKGKELFDKAQNRIEAGECVLTKQFIKRYNPNMLAPTRQPEDRSEFVRCYRDKGLIYIAKRWGDLGLRYKIRMFINKVKRKLGIR